MNLPAESAPNGSRPGGGELPEVENGLGGVDAQVVSRLYSELSITLERIAWSILRDWPLAADAVQEAFALLAQKWVDIPAEQRSGWLVKTVQFQAHNLRRKQRRAEQLPQQLLAQGWGVNGPIGAAGTPGSPVDERLEQAEQVALLRAAVQNLPLEQQRVVWGRLRDGKTFAQIASELNIPLGTVLSRMRLALEKLRSTLNGQ